jgi:predicted amidohydrolase
VSPWGEILAETGTDPGIIVAEMDAWDSATARARIPSLRHDRAFSDP